MTGERQLLLLPARTPAEASVWGGAVMAYSAAFPNVDLARDLAGVDWRGYGHVTVVRPRSWPADLALLIKQANPAARLDLIPVDSPETLQSVLNVRVYYGWRYGPQTDFDWAQLWKPGVALIGLHGRADGEFQPADYPVVQRARLEAVKITSHATLTTVKQLRAINPDMFILIRPMVSFTGADPSQPRRVSPQEFFDYTVDDVARLYDADASLRYIELHNEPNTRAEGLGGSWSDGREFGEWFGQVLALYRLRFPEARLGFPGLSPGATFAAGGRVDSGLFLDQAAEAAQLADWVGLHAYWVNEREMADIRLGFGFNHYRELFPEKLLFITEFGNPAEPKAAVAGQYARYYAMLRHVRGLGGAFAYILSTSDLVEGPRWGWRDEAGNDLGLAAVVGARQFIRETPVLP